MGQEEISNVSQQESTPVAFRTEIINMVFLLCHTQMHNGSITMQLFKPSLSMNCGQSINEMHAIVFIIE